MSGYENSVVCCPVECGQCGGSGCDDILSTDDIQWYCCSDLVIIAGVYCNETVQPPCIIGTGASERGNETEVQWSTGVSYYKRSFVCY